VTVARVSVPEADRELDVAHPVLDHGFVRLVDYLGGDDRIVQSARVSYGAGTKSVREDRALIHYLLKNEHTSPFEQVVLTFHLKMPIFVARQWVRHRTARLNEISGRYSVLADQFYQPAVSALRTQSKSNKQGRSDAPLSQGDAQRVLHRLLQGAGSAYADYTWFLKTGLAREVARIGLPLSLYTEMYWQIDLHNLFHFLKLRLSAHAQAEIREYGVVLARLTKAVCPVAYEAFEEHVLHGIAFSKTEQEQLRSALRASPGLQQLDAALCQRLNLTP
jgi:thymidylate synthase (FAD)